MFDNINEANVKKGVKWFLNKIRQSISKRKEDRHPKDIEDRQDAKRNLHNFNLYTTLYPNPKWKEELPFYDAMPLFLPLQVVRGSEGALLHVINIHFLPPNLRIRFLKELEILVRKDAERKGFEPDELSTYPKGNLTRTVGRYINNVYQSGGGSAGSMIRAAYRSYFFSRMRGKLKYIPVTQWEKAGNLILPAFRKAGPGEIYREIRETYNKYKNNYRKPIY